MKLQSYARNVDDVLSSGMSTITSNTFEKYFTCYVIDMQGIIFKLMN